MKKITLLKISVLSLLFAALLSITSVFVLRKINESSAQPYRLRLLLHLANEFESSVSEDFEFKTGEKRHGEREAHESFVIVTEQGQVLSSSDVEISALLWTDFPRSMAIHEVTPVYSLLGLVPEYSVMKLRTSPPAFLIEKSNPHTRRNVHLIAPLVLIFVMIGFSVFIALTMTFLYLQRKSAEAQNVLRRFESGDLKARFIIKPFDEIGHLAVDFNRMADELERLIHRLRDTEQTRRNLLQELSHDLRTPLTALQTSAETLKDHFDKMSPPDRNEFFVMIDREVKYVNQMINDLFFISELDEPHYKASIETVNLELLLKNEILSRGSQFRTELQWTFDSKLGSDGPVEILGDHLLILRLFRNGLDNASKYAKSAVRVRLFSDNSHWVVRIQDDGPGIDLNRADSFGQRRFHRSASSPDSAKLSLGLGSVIMKSIAELHKGDVRIFRVNESEGPGTILEFRLPKS